MKKTILALAIASTLSAPASAGFGFSDLADKAKSMANDAAESVSDVAATVIPQAEPAPELTPIVVTAKKVPTSIAPASTGLTPIVVTAKKVPETIAPASASGLIRLGEDTVQGSYDDLVRYDIKGFSADMTPDEFVAHAESFGGKLFGKDPRQGDPRARQSYRFKGLEMSLGGYAIDEVIFEHNNTSGCRCLSSSKRLGPWSGFRQTMTIRFAERLDEHERNSMMPIMVEKFDGHLPTTNVWAAQFDGPNADTGDVAQENYNMKFSGYEIELNYHIVKVLPQPTSDSSDF